MRTGQVAPTVGRFKKAKPKVGRRKAWEKRALSAIQIKTPQTHPHLFK